VLLMDGFYSGIGRKIRVTGNSFEFRSHPFFSLGTFSDQDSILLFCREDRPGFGYQDSIRFVDTRETGITITGTNYTSEVVVLFPRYGLPYFDLELARIVVGPGKNFKIEIPSDSADVYVNIRNKTPFRKLISSPGAYEAAWDLETFGNKYFQNQGCFSFEVLRRTKDSIFVTEVRDSLRHYIDCFVRVKDERRTIPLHEIQISREQSELLQKRLLERKSRMQEFNSRD